jgi:hypothetical protein
MSIFTLLGVLFIALKLAGVIVWPWAIVLLPLYAGLTIWLVLVVVVVALKVATS